MSEFTHYTEASIPEMVDVSSKDITKRTAKAAGFVRMNKKTIELIGSQLLPKGNPFEIAKIAGIMGAKRNADLIPLCHPLLLTYVDVKLEIDRERSGVIITSEIRLEGKTGAEMEALSAVSIAALTVYDMCKAVDKSMIIEDIKLIEKRGGKSDFSL